ncbi:hypothetical protein F2Q70_00006417 [Brassica cretica]|uniref:Uncharacterized protein n=1 Tax=Brassica cretica TaxID=69181 RepID=A0A8S9IQG9_BRACR|nr:hypothetical protein F2Q70_00006417 [Brassica cretica]
MVREGPTIATSPRERRPQTLDARCLQLPRDPPNTNQSKESQARTGSPLDTNYNRRHEIATPSDDAVVRRELKSKQRQKTRQAQTRKTGMVREGPTIATSPRERRPQTLDARCLQLPRDPPNTNQSKESQARTGSPLDTNYNRRHEIATPSDDAVNRETRWVHTSRAANIEREHKSREPNWRPVTNQKNYSTLNRTNVPARSTRRKDRGEKRHTAGAQVSKWRAKANHKTPPLKTTTRRVETHPQKTPCDPPETTDGKRNPSTRPEQNSSNRTSGRSPSPRQSHATLKEERTPRRDHRRHTRHLF